MCKLKETERGLVKLSTVQRLRGNDAHSVYMLQFKHSDKRIE